jgi:hypothetical protein
VHAAGSADATAALTLCLIFFFQPYYIFIKGLQISRVRHYIQKALIKGTRLALIDK